MRHRNHSACTVCWIPLQGRLVETAPNGLGRRCLRLAQMPLSTTPSGVEVRHQRQKEPYELSSRAYGVREVERLWAGPSMTPQLHQRLLIWQCVRPLSVLIWWAPPDRDRSVGTWTRTPFRAHAKSRKLKPFWASHAKSACTPTVCVP